MQISERSPQYPSGYCGDLLYRKCSYVLNFLHMPEGGSVVSVEFCDSSGTNVLDHLAADGACLPGSQVTVVAVLQVDADLGSCLHLEAVHSFAGLGDIDLVIVLHTKFSPLLSSDENTSRRKHFLFRNHSLTRVELCMNVKWRKSWENLIIRIGSFDRF